MFHKFNTKLSFFKTHNKTGQITVNFSNDICTKKRQLPLNGITHVHLNVVVCGFIVWCLFRCSLILFAVVIVVVVVVEPLS